MKFHSNKRKLSQVLYQARRMVPNRPVIPSTACTRIEATGHDTIIVQATNAKIGMTCETDASVEEPGIVITDAIRLHGIVSNMLGSSVEIRSGKGDNVLISSDDQKSRMVGLPQKEFLDVERYSGNGIVLDASKFKWMADRAVFAAAKDNARIILNGVLVDIVNGDAAMVGSDGHRMSIVNTKGVANNDVNKNVVVPLGAMRMIASTMKTGDIDMSISDSGRIMFSCGEYEIVSQVISGEYPHYSMIVPKDNSNTRSIIIPKNELVSAIGLCLNTIDEFTAHCSMTFNDDSVELSASSMSFGETSTKIAVETKGSGIPMRVGARVVYLEEVVSLIPSEFVKIRISGTSNLAPLLVTAEPEDGFMHILMPFQIH